MSPKSLVAGCVLGALVACGGKIVQDSRSGDGASPSADDTAAPPPRSPNGPTSSPTPTRDPDRKGLACVTPAECPSAQGCCLSLMHDSRAPVTSACRSYCGQDFELDERELCSSDDDCSDGEKCKTHYCGDDRRLFQFCGDETIRCYGP